MSKVLAKFALESVQDYYETGHQGDVAFLQSATVQLNAVQGEPFGPYTPFGRIQMGILNAGAAAVFVKEWQKYTAALQEWSASGGRLYVTFKLDTGEGAE